MTSTTGISRKFLPQVFVFNFSISRRDFNYVFHHVCTFVTVITQVERALLFEPVTGQEFWSLPDYFKRLFASNWAVKLVSVYIYIYIVFFSR